MLQVKVQHNDFFDQEIETDMCVKAASGRLNY